MSHQLELDFIYLLNHVFDKVYILKPDSSNVILEDRYVVCKYFLKKRSTALIPPLSRLVEEMTTRFLGKLLSHGLPCSFLIKIEEINVIIGQKQMDGLSHIINPSKHKSIDHNNKSLEDKSVQWQKPSRNPSPTLFKNVDG
jgi:hypothetical protein